MSFVDHDDVIAAISEAVLDATEAVTGQRPAMIERLTWHDAMDRFGVDKPDLRFEMELVELSDVFAPRPTRQPETAPASRGPAHERRYVDAIGDALRVAMRRDERVQRLRIASAAATAIAASPSAAAVRP